jgi:hypothetical protein
MTLAIELRPPTEPGEVETLTFDFGPALANVETITSVTSIKCAVIVGSDSATGHLQGAAAIEPSPSTGLPSQAVLQQVKSMLAGCTYQYQCLVLTSAGQALQLRVNLPCAYVPPGS